MKRVNFAPSPPRHSESKKMSDKNRLWGIFRSISTAKRAVGRTRGDSDRDRELDPSSRRRVSESDGMRHRRPVGFRPPSPDNSHSGKLPRRRPRRPEPATRNRNRDFSPDESEERRGNQTDRSRKARKNEDRWQPLTEWPPSGLSMSEELDATQASALIERGAPRHQGRKMSIPFREEDKFFALYTTTTTTTKMTNSVIDSQDLYPPMNRKGLTDAADLHDSMVKLMSMRIRHFPGAGPPDHPWESIEQPSFAFCYGSRPGTITLNHWASLNSVMPPPLILGDPGISMRDAELEVIMERIQELEIRGIVDDADNAALYKSLYRKFLRDPDRGRTPYKPMEKQITDLILVLSKPDWIDFTKLRNMVPTRYMFDPVNMKTEDFHRFFHQLLFSLELELRISWKEHTDAAKDALLKQLPPKVLRSLALARRWREYVRIDEYGKHPGDGEWFRPPTSSSSHSACANLE